MSHLTWAWTSFKLLNIINWIIINTVYNIYKVSSGWMVSQYWYKPGLVKAVSISPLVHHTSLVCLCTQCTFICTCNSLTPVLKCTPMATVTPWNQRVKHPWHI